MAKVVIVVRYILEDEDPAIVMRDASEMLQQLDNGEPIYEPGDTDIELIEGLDTVQDVGVPYEWPKVGDGTSVSIPTEGVIRVTFNGQKLGGSFPVNLKEGEVLVIKADGGAEVWKGEVDND